MYKLLGRSVLITVFIVAPLIFITNSIPSLENISVWIKVLIWIGAGLFSIAVVLVINRLDSKKPAKPARKSRHDNEQ
jgi:hypothetical protein